MRLWIFAVVIAAVATSANAACPKIGVAPRTLFGSAQSYAESKGFGIDDKEILVYDYGTRYDNLGKFRNPYFISNYANALYRDWIVAKCANDDLKRKFLIQADYLMSAATFRNEAAVWLYPFDSGKFKLKAGWISGIGQSRIAGVLYRAFAIMGNEKYRDMAEAAMHVYEIAPADGGVASIRGDEAWYEEAADLGGASYAILNGHITALSGILDFHQITQEDRWKTAFDRGVTAVRRNISKFDAGFVSYYSLAAPADRVFAGRDGYNGLHVSQLLWLYEVDGDPLFLDWAMRFLAYETWDYAFSAQSSIKPDSHGPDQAAAYFGSRYWSAKPPTWFEVRTKEPQVYKGLALVAAVLKQAPSDFNISAWIDGAWKPVETVSGNTAVQYFATFKDPVKTEAFRIDLKSSNGKLVVLYAALPIRADVVRRPIANECNLRADKNYSFHEAIKGRSGGQVRVFCPGWIVLPSEGASSLSIGATASGGADIVVEFSDDLRRWQGGQHVSAQSGKVDVKGRYTKLSFSEGVSAFDILRLD